MFVCVCVCASDRRFTVSIHYITAPLCALKLHASYFSPQLCIWKRELSGSDYVVCARLLSHWSVCFTQSLEIDVGVSVYIHIHAHMRRVLIDFVLWSFVSRGITHGSLIWMWRDGIILASFRAYIIFDVFFFTIAFIMLALIVLT